jgi:hypothetical protein
MCKGEDDQDTPHWYDDNIFNEFQEEFCDIIFKGRALAKAHEIEGRTAYYKGVPGKGNIVSRT